MKKILLVVVILCVGCADKYYKIVAPEYSDDLMEISITEFERANYRLTNEQKKCFKNSKYAYISVIDAINTTIAEEENDKAEADNYAMRGTSFLQRARKECNIK
ncbi:MAG: hypothetical protein Ta2D_02480 [Rickettsiales bacterium]|nr:MAG: hypothetical protein Ta2D_02480 [Rickettsiales bacterium]